MTENNKSDANRDAGSDASHTPGAKGIALRTADQAKHMLGKRLGKPGADLDKLAKSLRLTSQQLEGNVAGPYIDKAAAGLERVSGYLEEIDPVQVARTVESFARRNPWTFLGSALGIGVVAGRFIRSSAAPAASSTEPRHAARAANRPRTGASSRSIGAASR